MSNTESARLVVDDDDSVSRGCAPCPAIEISVLSCVAVCLAQSVGERQKVSTRIPPVNSYAPEPSDKMDKASRLDPKHWCIHGTRIVSARPTGCCAS